MGEQTVGRGLGQENMVAFPEDIFQTSLPIHLIPPTQSVLISGNFPSLFLANLTFILWLLYIQ
jgi:hypothetical protein